MIEVLITLFNLVVQQLKKFFNHSQQKIKQAIISKAFGQKWQCLILIGLAAFSAWLMVFTFSYEGDQFIMRSRLWSDFAAHLPLIRSFSLGKNFPVEYPQFAGEPIRYHFLFYLVVGLLERIGLNLGLALNLLSSIGFFGLLAMIFFLAGKLTTSKINNDKTQSGRSKLKQVVNLMPQNNLFKSSQKIKKETLAAGVLAVFLFLFNSSLTFVDYFQERGFTVDALIAIPSNDQFINFGPWNGDDISAFWHWNVYTNQRHLGFSLAVALLAIWPLVKAAYSFRPDKSLDKKSLDKKNMSAAKLIKSLKLIGLWLALISLPFLNFASYVMVLFFIAAWFILNPKLLKHYGPYYAVGILLSLPGFLYYWRLGGSAVAFQPGFLAQDKTLSGIAYYWWRNIGLYIFMWPILFIVGNLWQKKWWLIFTAYFLLANLFQLSPDIINNHKLINFFQIGVACLLAAKLAGFWIKSAAAKAAILLLLIPLTLSGFIDAAAIVNDHRASIDDPVAQPLGKWLINNTPPESVFVTTQYLYNPVSLVGRKTYLDYGYFAWSMGYDDSRRRQRLKQIFSSQIELQDWCRLMMQENLNFVLVSPGQGELDIAVRESWLVKNLQPVYETGDGYLVYNVKQVCNL